MRQEQAAQDPPCGGTFREDSNGIFVMEKEEAMYDFLTDVLDTFHSYGEVYDSPALGDKQIRPSSPTVGFPSLTVCSVWTWTPESFPGGAGGPVL